jgi:hypothetical protein
MVGMVTVAAGASVPSTISPPAPKAHEMLRGVDERLSGASFTR